MTTLMQGPAQLHAATAPTIRPYRSADAGAIRRIWRSTLALGSPLPFEIAALSAYRRLCIDWYLDQWNLAAGRSDVVVVEHAGDVTGYLLACLDEAHFRRWQRRAALRWMIAAAAKYPGLGDDARAFVRSRIIDGWHSLRTWRANRSTSAIADGEFPAHMHFNLDSHLRGMDVGHRLAAWMDERVRQAGLGGYMGEINVPAGRSLRALEAAGVRIVGRTRNRTLSRLAAVPVDRCRVSRDLAAIQMTRDIGR
jgi:hypothetical protein